MVIDQVNIVSLIGDLGALGLVFWMTVRLTNHTIPRLASQFEKTAEDQRQDFKEILKQQREDLLAALDRQEKSHHLEIEKLVDSIRELTIEVRGWRKGE